MELTPKVFRDVQFREKLRGGYHPEDVDEFLEQAAVAVDAMQTQLRQALERAQRAEQATVEASSVDESLRKMLVLAQRTADQAVNEARFEADKLLNEARFEADKLLNEARAKAEGLLVEAQEQSRRAYEQGMAESRESMTRAEERLRQAQQEVEALRNWVEVHRPHLLSVLRDAQSLVENAGLLSEPPAVSTSLASSSASPSYVDIDEAAQAPAELDEGEQAAAAGANGPGNRAAEEPTGEWGPEYLQAVGAMGDGAGSDQEGGDQGPEVPNGHTTLAKLAPASGALSAGSRGDATMAFDERALDSFFNDQDLGESRGLGRFRRRQ
ncbi:MAG TPA: DivIVA domain-containing protein [Acidimicrobiales bacterium]|nr:DivIVA domain-containing protein [Acidimicrobiales bacterium]